MFVVPPCDNVFPEIESIGDRIEYPDAADVVTFLHVESVRSHADKNHAVVYLYGVLIYEERNITRFNVWGSD